MAQNNDKTTDFFVLSSDAWTSAGLTDQNTNAKPYKDALGRYQEVVSYLDDVYDAIPSELFRVNLKRLLAHAKNPSDPANSALHALLAFAWEQDSMYAKSDVDSKSDVPPKYTINTNELEHLTDDLFEIYFYMTYVHGRRDCSEDEYFKLSVIHDAWAAARLLNFDSRTGMLVPVTEDGVNPPVQYVGQLNIPDHQQVAVAYKGGYTIVQGRRINQFVPFSKLNLVESNKDNTPLLALKKVISIHSNGLKNLVEYIRGSRVSYVMTVPEGRIVQATQLPELVSWSAFALKKTQTVLEGGAKKGKSNKKVNGAKGKKVSTSGKKKLAEKN